MAEHQLGPLLPEPQSEASAKALNRNLAARIGTALVAIPGLILLITAVPKGYGLLFFGVLVSTLALLEYFRLVLIPPRRPVAILTFLLVAFLWYGTYSFFEVVDSGELNQRTRQLEVWLPIAAILLMPVFSLALLFDPHTHRPLHTLGLLFIGIFYVVIPFILFYISGFRLGDRPLDVMDLKHPTVEYSWLRPLGILMLTWCSDSAQYFAGRCFGRHKLWPKISPSKTWEGAFGGLVATMLLGWGLQGWWPEADVNWLLVAAIVMVFGLLGDLIESQFKRSVKVKDSGGLLPGHGGLLDRFDSFLLAMPILAAYFFYIAVVGS